MSGPEEEKSAQQPNANEPDEEMAEPRTTQQNDEELAQQAEPHDSEAHAGTPQPPSAAETGGEEASDATASAEPVSGQPAPEEPEGDESVTEESVTEEPAAEEPAAEEPATEEPATEEPVAAEPATAEPAAAEPVAEEPAVAEPRAHAPSPREQAKEAELVRTGMHWYVLRVASNKEDQVREALDRKVKIEQLEDRVGRVLVPTQREKRVRGGAARVYHRKLYPGYVFVEMATDEDGRIPENVWFVIKETTGVGDFIGSGGKPSPMPPGDVEKMLAAAIKPEESPALANLAFNKGDRVKVTEGPFENFEGVVDEINTQKGTVRVIVTIFGRPTPIEIEYWQVEQL